MTQTLSIVALVLWMQLFLLQPAGAEPQGSAQPITPTSRDRKEAVSPALSAALERAQKQAKYLFVAVLKKGDDDSAKLVRTTLADGVVVQWMEHRAILLELHVDDPDVQQFVADRKIETFPTVLVLANDGRELGRQNGFTPPHGFLTRVNAAIQSDAIRPESGIRSWAGEDVIMNIAKRARAITAGGRHEEALKEFTWCLDHRAARSPLFPSTHLEELVAGVAKLAEAYQPAMKLFRLRLSQAERKSLQSARPQVYSLYLVKFGHLALGREDKVVQHYDRLLRRWPQSSHATVFARIIYGPLLNARRYKAIADTVSDAQAVDLFLEESRRKNRDVREVQSLLAGRYEILLGLGRDRDAEVLVEKVLAYDRSAGTYLALAEAALRSGRATDVNIAQARNAYTMTKKNNGDAVIPSRDRKGAVIVLAKLLAQRKPYDPEAIQIIKSAQDELTTEADQAALAECLREIQLNNIPFTKERSK
ncbi:MAG: hypothetical protein V3W34_18060 [Phycisphaerae bacterium]